QRPLPAAFEAGAALNLVASGAVLEKMAREQPERLAALREAVHGDKLEVCGGAYIEREDPLLPLESQLWNLHRGLDVSREVLGRPVRVYGRRQFGAHPLLPTLLTAAVLYKVLLLAFDDAAL